jgi:hypothetical protein
MLAASFSMLKLVNLCVIYKYYFGTKVFNKDEEAKLFVDHYTENTPGMTSASMPAGVNSPIVNDKTQKKMRSRMQAQNTNVILEIIAFINQFTNRVVISISLFAAMWKPVWCHKDCFIAGCFSTTAEVMELPQGHDIPDKYQENVKSAMLQMRHIQLKKCCCRTKDR